MSIRNYLWTNKNTWNNKMLKLSKSTKLWQYILKVYITKELTNSRLGDFLCRSTVEKSTCTPVDLSSIPGRGKFLKSFLVCNTGKWLECPI